MTPLDATPEALRAAVERMRETADETLRAVVKLSSDHATLARLMHEPGQDSLPTRVRLLEEKLDLLISKVQRADALRWQVYFAVVTSVLAPLAVWLITMRVVDRLVTEGQ